MDVEEKLVTGGLVSLLLFGQIWMFTDSWRDFAVVSAWVAGIVVGLWVLTSGRKWARRLRQRE